MNINYFSSVSGLNDTLSFCEPNDFSALLERVDREKVGLGDMIDIFLYTMSLQFPTREEVLNLRCNVERLFPEQMSRGDKKAQAFFNTAMQQFDRVQGKQDRKRTCRTWQRLGLNLLLLRNGGYDLDTLMQLSAPVQNWLMRNPECLETLLGAEISPHMLIALGPDFQEGLSRHFEGIQKLVNMGVKKAEILSFPPDFQEWLLENYTALVVLYDIFPDIRLRRWDERVVRAMVDNVNLLAARSEVGFSLERLARFSPPIQAELITKVPILDENKISLEMFQPFSPREQWQILSWLSLVKFGLSLEEIAGASADFLQGISDSPEGLEYLREMGFSFEAMARWPFCLQKWALTKPESLQTLIQGGWSISQLSCFLPEGLELAFNNPHTWSAFRRSML